MLLDLKHMKGMTNAYQDNGQGSPPQVTMRSSLGSNSNKMQSASDRRRSLNVSHFNAVQAAVSQLARIDDFDLEELGYGFFSDVFKVTHKQTGKVMVLKRNKETNSKMNILREVQLMNRLSHPNILKFKGVCVHEGQLHGLTEFINGGDLEKLVTKKNIRLSWKQRIQIAHDISQGMKYLHAIGIFHRDLSAKNCLVSISTDNNGKKKYKAVVADLGLAEKIPTCTEDEKRFAMVGTPYIMAPEVIHGQPYNEKADIFSYGLILCQLMALVSCDPEELPRSYDFGLAIDTFQRLLTSNETTPPNELLQLAYDCCQLEPKARPTFSKIVACLEAILTALKKKKRASSFRVDDSARSRYSASTTRSSQPSANNGNSTVSPSKPPMSPRGRRPSSTSRLSRSFSDISRELLTHAANMACSANDDDESSFTNPFSTLEHLEGGNAKLTDEPSLALLEMTFDIATTDYRKTSWVEETDGPSSSSRGLKKRQPRPKSVFASFNEPMNNNPGVPSPPTTLNISSPAHSIRHRSSDSIMSSPRSHCSTPDGMHQSDEYRLALHRAMILSPRGNNLASWWCARKRAEGDSGTAKERQSLASVISVLSRNVAHVRRSISLPDVSRISTLFKTHEPGSLENSLTAADRKPRSRTGDEVFYGSSSQEFSLSGANSIKTEFNRPSPKLIVSDHDSCGSGSTGHHVTFAPQEEAKIFFPQEEETERLPIVQEGDSDLLDANAQSISSSSSGCSSSGLLVCSAEMSQLRRKDSNDRSRRHEPMVAPSVVNHSCLRRESSDRTHSSKSKNRDSGYEEDHHVHHPTSPVLESGNEHVVWSIQENEHPSSTAGDCCAEIPYSSCSGAVTDWNSNENHFHPSKHKLRSDAVL
uniref:dual-specificity kinase n=1 Tax=Phallusia mammillata TaxID=59560 RepID=A0A6F9DV61_9ASCI|nr:fatty acyl-CoA synthetase and RNA processing-associated kinase 1-like [Phallusia mammillata]